MCHNKIQINSPDTSPLFHHCVVLLSLGVGPGLAAVLVHVREGVADDVVAVEAVGQQVEGAKAGGTAQAAAGFARPFQIILGNAEQSRNG